REAAKRTLDAASTALRWARTVEGAREPPRGADGGRAGANTMTAPLAAPDLVTCAAGTPGAHEHRHWAGMGSVLRADARAGAEGRKT
ncbi:MAG: hypothetical protein ACK5X3_04015, partial [Pseudomonadota bacterium]